MSDLRDQLRAGLSENPPEGPLGEQEPAESPTTEAEPTQVSVAPEPVHQPEPEPVVIAMPEPTRSEHRQSVTRRTQGNAEQLRLF
ncbi:hypothetical protein [Paludisphaera soli]|uniref:hypothetical protein n=1 Tax=Paludisphaera soli TaxID=2712865 RepID=UPI0013EB0ABF|nr:hypothetical protein [Paludisphaera soli]